MHCHSLSGSRWDGVRCYICLKKEKKKRSSNHKLSSGVISGCRWWELYERQRVNLSPRAAPEFSVFTQSLVDFAPKWRQTGVLKLLMSAINSESVDWFSPPTSPQIQPRRLSVQQHNLTGNISVRPIRIHFKGGYWHDACLLLYLPISSISFSFIWFTVSRSYCNILIFFCINKILLSC